MATTKPIILISLYDPWAFGVCTLHTVLKEAGHKPISVFFKTTTPMMVHTKPTEDEINILKTFVAEQNPLFIGVSLRSTNFHIAKEITQELRKVTQAPILWGGIHPTISPERCIPEADMVCIGEGEEAVAELANRMSKCIAYDTIPNLWVNTPFGIVKNEVRPLIDLNTVPYPNFLGHDKYLIENNKLTNLAGSEKERTTYFMMTTRGCLFACSFCCNYNLRQIYKGKGQYVRRRDVIEVISELLYAKATFPNLKEVRFIDDVFTFDKEWILRFCELYRYHINLPFHCLCHPRYTDETIITALKEAGLVGVIMGIQTGSEQFKKECYGRNESNADILKADALLHKHSIRRYYDIILNNPMETEADKLKTFNLLMQLQRPFELHTFSLTHFPHTRMTEQLLEKKLISESDVEDEKMNTWNGTFCSVLNEGHSNDSLYWENLYYLTQKAWMPKWMIDCLSNWDYFRNNASTFTKALKYTSFNIYSVRQNETTRRKLILVYNNPKILFSQIKKAFS